MNSETIVFEEVKGGAMVIFDNAKEVAKAIIDDKTYLAACELRKSVRKEKKDAVNRCEDIRAKAYGLYKAVLAERDLAVDPFDQALAVLDPPISAYDTEQKRLAKIEQDRLDEENRKQQETIRINQAAKLESQGKSEKAAQVLEKPIVAAKVHVPTVQAKGMSFRENWSVSEESENIDLKALLSAIVAGTVPIQAIKPDFVFLNKMAVAMKGAMAYPGIKVEMKKIPVSR